MKPECPFSRAEKIGGLAFVLALAASFLQPCLAIIPLGGFLFVCLAAPFLPRLALFLPIISQGRPGSEGIALTFDDGPSPDSTPLLLDLLNHYNLQATFFVVGKKAAAHPELITQILAQGHTIGNHSYRHDYLLMLRSQKKLAEDIHRTQEILKEFGIQPLLFRPPAGITNPRLKCVLKRENLIALAYSCRALDRGNRNVTNLSKKILTRLQSGDIIMLHDTLPRQKKVAEYWQRELEQLFTALQSNHNVVPLEILLERPIMET